MNELKKLRQEYGSDNCLGTCVSCLFESDINEFPTDEIITSDNDKWFDVFSNYMMINFGVQPISSLEPMNNSYNIVIGNVTRSKYTHAVISYGDKIIWDPHPSDEGLIEVLFYIHFEKF